MTCPLNILLLGLVAVLLFILFTKNGGHEGYRPGSYRPGAYIPRPEESGFERPLWGKLMTLPSVSDDHLTFAQIPNCMPPIGSCKYGAQGNIEIPYSYDKI